MILHKSKHMMLTSWTLYLACKPVYKFDMDPVPGLPGRFGGAAFLGFERLTLVPIQVGSNEGALQGDLTVQKQFINSLLGRRRSCFARPLTANALSLLVYVADQDDGHRNNDS